MTDRELPDVRTLRVLEPPPGGLARVRETIDREAQPRPRWWLVVPTLAAAAALVALLLLAGRAPRTIREARVVPIATATAPLADPSVGEAFYWVASQPRAAPAVQRAQVATIDSVGSAPVVLEP